MARHSFCLQNIKISCEYIDFWAKSYYISYPPFEISTSKVTIVLVHGKYFCGIQYCQLQCYVSDSSLTVIRAADSSKLGRLLPSTALSSAKLLTVR